MNLSIIKPKQFQNEIKKRTKVNKKPLLCPHPPPITPPPPPPQKKDNNNEKKET